MVATTGLEIVFFDLSLNCWNIMLCHGSHSREVAVGDSDGKDSQGENHSAAGIVMSPALDIKCDGLAKHVRQ